MKFLYRISLLVFLFVGLAATISSAQKMTKLNISLSFKGIEPGYDHLNKLLVYTDGKLVKESPESKQSVPGNMTVMLPLGKQEISLVGYAFYEGYWEEHSVSNHFSIDCAYYATQNLKNKNKLALLFDLDKGITSKWK